MSRLDRIQDLAVRRAIGHDTGSLLIMADAIPGLLAIARAATEWQRCRFEYKQLRASSRVVDAAADEVEQALADFEEGQ